MGRDDEEAGTERLNPPNPSWPFESEDYIRSSADSTQNLPSVKIDNILCSAPS